MRNIIYNIRKQPEMPDETVDLLTKQLIPCRFPKRYPLIREGVHHKYVYFIEKGVIQSYRLVDGKEATISFPCGGDTVFNMDELYYGRLSEEFVEALEDVLFYAILTKTLIELYETNIGLANWERVIRQNRHRELHRKYRERLTLLIREGYIKLKEGFLDACNRVNLGYITAYLGIISPALSKMRAEE